MSRREKGRERGRGKKVHIIQYLFNILWGASVHQATDDDVRCVYRVEYDQKLIHSVRVKIYQFTLIMAGAKANVYSIYFVSPFRHIILSHFNSWTLCVHNVYTHWLSGAFLPNLWLVQRIAMRLFVVFLVFFLFGSLKTLKLRSVRLLFLCEPRAHFQ